jgi:DNA-binding transcriptional regulator YhcF (GntR family)
MTKYLEIAEHIREKILTGELPPGSKAPTLREVADMMNVNPNTAWRALTELVLEGYVVMDRESDTRFICCNVDFIIGQRNETAQRTARTYLSKMAKLGYRKAEAIKYISDYEKEII